MKQLKLNIFTGSGIPDRLVLTIKNTDDLGRVASGGKGNLVSKTNSSGLDFTVSDHTLVLHLIENGHTEGTVGVSLLNGKSIEDIDQSGSRVPGTSSLGRSLSDVLSSQTRDGYPEEVILSVT